MARTAITPKRRFMRRFTLEERVQRFRTHQMDWSLPLGESLGRYFALWREAKEGGVSDNEASQRLIGVIPMSWRPWVRAREEEIRTLDPVTYDAVGDFPQLVGRTFAQWLISKIPPAPEREAADSEPELVGPEEQRGPREQDKGKGKRRKREETESRPPPEVKIDSVVPPLRRRRNDFEAGSSRVPAAPVQQAETFPEFAERVHSEQVLQQQNSIRDGLLGEALDPADPWAMPDARGETRQRPTFRAEMAEIDRILAEAETTSARMQRLSTRQTTARMSIPPVVPPSPRTQAVLDADGYITDFEEGQRWSPIVVDDSSDEEDQEESEPEEEEEDDETEDLAGDC